MGHQKDYRLFRVIDFLWGLFDIRGSMKNVPLLFCEYKMIWLALMFMSGVVSSWAVIQGLNNV